jgi:hypothetical protein
MRWTSAVNRSTSAGSITICGFGLSVGVASDDPIVKRSCWTVLVKAAISASSQIDRANPSVEFSSSIVP